MNEFWHHFTGILLVPALYGMWKLSDRLARLEENQKVILENHVPHIYELLDKIWEKLTR